MVKPMPVVKLTTPYNYHFVPLAITSPWAPARFFPGVGKLGGLGTEVHQVSRDWQGWSSSGSMEAKPPEADYKL